jgi:hypothetical protein
MNPPDSAGTTPPPAAPAGRKIRRGRPPYALLGTLAYLCFGTAWILAGQILTVSIANPERVAMFELIKGLAYIGLSGLLVYALIRFAQPPARVMKAAGEENPYTLAAQGAQHRLNQLPWLVTGVMLLASLLVTASLFWWRAAALERAEQANATLQHAISAHIDTTLNLVERVLREVIADYFADPKSANRDLRHLCRAARPVRAQCGCSTMKGALCTTARVC